jgi:nucleotide-binding universal stress UspA family protein
MATTADVPSGAVIAGFDGSPRSRRAVDWAVEEAGRWDAPLFILQRSLTTAVVRVFPEPVAASAS